MAGSYNQRMGSPGTGEVLGVVALTLAAGALATLLVLTAKKEKISLGTLGEANPKDWLAKAAQALERGRERLINSVEERSGGSSRS